MSTNIERLRSRASIQREASEWIARLHADSVLPEERSRFHAWYEGSTHNARAYDELAATWRHLERTGDLVRSVSLGQAFNDASIQAIRRARAIRGHRVRLATAATLLLGIGAVGWWAWPGNPRTEFQTAVGEHATVKLSDGSFLELNTATLVHVRLTADRRLVQLDRGEAFFRIARDSRRPFDVTTAETTVRALGTAFSVRTRAAGVDVTVMEGRVQLLPVVSTSVAANGANPTAAIEAGEPLPRETATPPADRNIVSANEQAIVERAAIAIKTILPAETTQRLAWRTGSVYFQSAPLGTVVDELSRYTTQRIVIEDNTLEDLSIGGTFDTTPEGAEALLTTLQDGFGLKVRRDGHTAYIERGTGPTPAR